MTDIHLLRVEERRTTHEELRTSGLYPGDE